MNDRGREALVAAALTGVRQIKGNLRDEQGGRCAMGVMLESINGVPSYIQYEEELKALDMTTEEIDRVVNANNKLGWDFLTIARKF